MPATTEVPGPFPRDMEPIALRRLGRARIDRDDLTSANGLNSRGDGPVRPTEKAHDPVETPQEPHRLFRHVRVGLIQKVDADLVQRACVGEQSVPTGPPCDRRSGRHRDRRLIPSRLRSLDHSGVYAAAVIGTIIFGLGGWPWAVLLLTFFISSTALTRSFKRRKAGAGEKFAKGGRRDAGQVFGNGGIAALFAFLGALSPEAYWPWLGFAGALAAVNADTWATELGVLSPGSPRLLTDLRKRVEKGTSGAVSSVGTLAALAGAGSIGVLAALLSPDGTNWNYFWSVTLAGLIGSLIDSLLGATVQGMYYCPACQKETERVPNHSCGAITTQTRGWKWLNNDWVNAFCSGAGSLALLLYLGAFSI